MEEIRIVPAFAKGKVCRNKASGHTWVEPGHQKGWEVIGGGFSRSFFRKIERAQAEVDLRRSMIGLIT